MLIGFAARNSTAEPPALQPCPTEVSDAWWVNTKYIDPQRLVWRRVPLDELVHGLQKVPIVPYVVRWLGCERVDFAAIDLPPPPPASPASADAAAPAASDAADAAAVAAAAGRALDCPLRQRYQLWGLTLGFFSDVYRASAHSQPLVGAGAPEPYAQAFRPASGTRLAAVGFRILAALRLHGLQRVAIGAAAAITGTTIVTAIAFAGAGAT